MFGFVGAGSLDWDRSMMARLAAGDDSALAAIFDQYSPLVHGVARQLVGGDQAGDICQEVFLTLWQHPDRYDPGRGSLRSLLAIMARRRCIDVLRSSGRRAAREHAVASQPVVPAPNVEEAAMAVAVAERLRAALAVLPEAQREAIELAYLNGLTFQAVAATLGIPEGTAKSRLRLGLGRLSRELSGWENIGGAHAWT